MINFIAENTIDETVERLEDFEDHQSLINELGEIQPGILAYLTSESFDLFSDEERDFLFFMTLVIVGAIQKQHPDLAVVTEDELGEAEERNWELFEKTKARAFRDKLDTFFDKYPQEDLLAFVEDALESDEDSLITKEGSCLLYTSPSPRDS